MKNIEIDQIGKIQIQTIDTCNSRCVFCPHKSIKRTGRLMPVEDFLSILKGIRDAYRQKLIRSGTFVKLHFQSEPLEDPYIFQRVKRAKEILPPELKVGFFTNCFNVAKLFNHFTNMRIDLIQFNIYGKTIEELERHTGVKLNENQFLNMNKSVRKIAQFIKGCHINRTAPVKGSGRFLTRANFWEDKPIHSTISGCSRSHFKSLSIYADGNTALCCNDWRRNTDMGNVFKTPITEILTGPKRLHIIKQVIGAVDSPEDFICKKCELAIPGGNEAKNKS